MCLHLPFNDDIDASSIRLPILQNYIYLSMSYNFLQFEVLNSNKNKKISTLDCKPL